MKRKLHYLLLLAFVSSISVVCAQNTITVVLDGGSDCWGMEGVYEPDGTYNGKTRYSYFDDTYDQQYIRYNSLEEVWEQFWPDEGIVSFYVHSASDTPPCSGWLSNECDGTITLTGGDCGTAVGKRLYVNVNVLGGNSDGSSWVDAYEYLSDALEEASSAAIDTIFVAKGTYEEGTFTIESDVVIYGGFTAADGVTPNPSDADPAANPTILDGDDSYRILYTEDLTANTMISGFTFFSGFEEYGGALYNANSSPSITSCVFTLNEATYGGAVYNDSSNPSFTTCAFLSNSTPIGGAVYNYNSIPAFTSCYFEDNDAYIGGAVYSENDGLASITITGLGACSIFNGEYYFIGYGDDNKSVYYHDSAPAGIVWNSDNQLWELDSQEDLGFTNSSNSDSPPCTGWVNADCNEASSLNITGGGCGGNSAVAFTNCEFVENFATMDGGAIYNDGVNVEVTGCTFTSNISCGCDDGKDVNGGGAIYSNNGFATVSNSNFISNTAYNGGAIYADDYVDISNSTFTENYAEYEGGAIYVNDDMLVESSTFTSNYSDEYGGAFYVNSDVEINNSTFNGNYSYEGGAIFGDNDVDLENTNFSGNYTYEGYYGGAILMEGEDLDASNCTFDGNSACYGGSLYLYDESSADLVDCTFKNDSAFEGGSIYIDDYNYLDIHTCTFSDNEASGDGGVMFLENEEYVEIYNSIFERNSAANGGVISYYYEDVTEVYVYESVFTENTALDTGGVVYMDECDDGDHVFLAVNTVFYKNIADDEGAIMYASDDYYADFVNCTFVANEADDDIFYTSNLNYMDAYNCIFWKNMDDGELARESDELDNKESNLYSDDGVDPKFIDIDNPKGDDGIWMTTDDGFRIKTYSSAIDGGSTSFSYSYSDTDLAGNPRFREDGYGVTPGANIDMGAYEYIAGAGPKVLLMGIQSACDGSNGSINIRVPNDMFAPYTYLWSTGATTEDVSNLDAGNYTVVVTNSEGVKTEMSFNVYATAAFATFPADTTFLIETCDVAVTWVEPTLSENCGSVDAGNLTVNYENGSNFSHGTYNVIYSLTTGNTVVNDTLVIEVISQVTNEIQLASLPIHIPVLANNCDVVFNVNEYVSVEDLCQTGITITSAFDGTTLEAGETYNIPVVVNDLHANTSDTVYVNLIVGATMTYANPTTVCGNSGLLNLVAHYGNGAFNLPFTSNNTFNVTAAYNAYVGQGMTPPFKVGFTYSYQTDGCNLVVSDTLILEKCVGVADNFSAEEFSLYPNPTRGNVTIALPASLTAESVTTKVINTVGKVVLEENVTVSNQTIKLDYSSLAAGVYFVEVSSEANQAVMLPFVIQE